MDNMRINVLGASGSGASTVGRALAAALSVPYFDGDDYFHGPSDPPFQNPRSAQDRFDRITRDILPDKSWVLGGGIAGWAPYPELDFRWIVFLYVPTSIRIERLRHREQERFGDRILVGGDMHQGHADFIDWASRYDAGDVEGKTMARHEVYLRDQKCPVLEFRGEMPVATILESVLKSIEQPDK